MVIIATLLSPDRYTDTGLLELEVQFVGIGKFADTKKIALLLEVQKKMRVLLELAKKNEGTPQTVV